MMTDLYLLFAFAVVLMAFVVNIALWSKRHISLKFGALAAAVLFFGTVYFGFSNLLSRPKPVNIEWAQRNMEQATVLGAKMEEGEAIYVWLAMEGVVEPRAYVLPWSKNAARQLHEAQQEAEAQGAEVMMRLPFRMSQNTVEEQQFYTPPQTALPAKKQ